MYADQTSDIKQFAQIIKDIKFTMLTTIDPADGSLHGRPMTLQETEFDGILWFFAARSSEVVKQIQKNTNVNLSFSHPKQSSFISAQGNAIVTLDRDKEKELWNPGYKAWFPKGLSDPDLCLIKVNVLSADYWESTDSNLVKFFNFAKSMVTGKNNFEYFGKYEHFSLN